MFFKRTIPVAIAFVCGLWFAIQPLVPTDLSAATVNWGSTWFKVIAGFATVLGLYSLCMLHWTRIKRRQPGYGYSVLVYVSLIVTLFFGLIGEVDGFLSYLTGREVALGGFQTYAAQNSEYTYSSGFTWIFNAFYVPAASTMFSLLAFFIASAAYRTFRARSTEAALLLVAATIVMLGQVPLAAVVSESIPKLADWIMLVPSMAAKRGIMLGVSLGVVATALRITFGIERAYLGGE